MGRHKLPYLLRKRETGYWFFKLPDMRNYRTTGKTTKAEAMQVVQEQLMRPPEVIAMEVDESSLSRWASSSWRHLGPRERIAVLYTIYLGRCHYCHGVVRLSGWRDVKSVERATLDHKIPLVGGGPDTFENAILSCQPCNVRKGPVSYDTYREIVAED